METRRRALATAEFLVLDTETNGCAGEACEMTEIGAVLVGGGELHERFESLVATRRALGAGIQRFTGITQAMVALAPEPAEVLPPLLAQLEGRVLVAHSASFDVRVLRQACAREGLRWPDPPALCTIALARRLAPLARRRALAPLADSLGIEVGTTHRALADAELCARVFCALFPRLCASAATVGEALEEFGPRRGRRSRTAVPRVRRQRSPGPRRPLPATLDFSALPDRPGVYMFRDGRGKILYVGKSTRLRSRARRHFTGGDSEPAAWTAQATSVDHRATCSELGALVLENRLIKAENPPGNVALKQRPERSLYLRCRLDIAFPILELASEPAAGHALCVGPLAGRRAAAELLDQLNSLFSLRRCGRALPRRVHPSIYGQMDRCLSPCLGDLDPNAYRSRLDAALAVFSGPHGAGRALREHLEAEMRRAAQAQLYERAAVLRRRAARIEVLIDRLGGVLRAAGRDPRLILAAAPRGDGWDALWLAGGHVTGWEAVAGQAGLDAIAGRTAELLAAAGPARATTYLTAAQADEVRIVDGWLSRHEVPALALDPAPTYAAVTAFVAEAGGLSRRGGRTAA